MSKKLISGPILACLPQIWTSKKFFFELYIDELLKIVGSYYHIPFIVKLMNEA